MTDSVPANQPPPTTMADALFSKTQQKVLGLIYGKPDKTFFTNEIARWAGVGKGSVIRELERMHSAGLVCITHIGNQTHYQANSQCPIYNELLGIVRKTFGMADVINAALQPLAGQIQWAFIYGSIAKNAATAESDIDLMLVGDNIQYGTVMNLLLPAEQTLARRINPAIYTPQAMASQIAGDNSFITRVLAQEKITLSGKIPVEIASNPLTEKPPQGANNE